MTTIGRQLSVCIEDCCDTDSSESAIIPAHVVKKFVKSTYRVGLVMHACRLLRLLHAYFSAHRDMINGSVGLLSSMATVLQPLMKLLRFVTVCNPPCFWESDEGMSAQFVFETGRAGSDSSVRHCR
jgi:hypothetical protein